MDFLLLIKISGWIHIACIIVFASKFIPLGVTDRPRSTDKEIKGFIVWGMSVFWSGVLYWGSLILLNLKKFL